MLNEFLELNEYTCPLDKVYPCRLTWGNIVKGFSGVPRALSVISRYAYYEMKMKPEVIDILLKKWCGFDIENEQIIIDDMPEFANVSKWLPSYIEKLSPEKSKKTAEEINKKREEIFEELKGNSKKWTRSAFQLLGGVNDKNSIYFDGIIADAINEGPLCNRCLVFKKDPAWGACKVTSAAQKSKFYDQWLKIIAAVLIGRIDESEYSNVDFGVVSNWLKTGGAEGKKIKGVIDKIRYNIGDRKDVGIISIIHTNNDDDKYLRLDPEWLSLYSPRIVIKDEWESCDKKDCIYVDMGCDEPLRELKR